MATKLEIYNLTLSKLGQRRLSSLDEDSENRRKLDTIWDNVLERTIVSGPEKGWKFAKTRNIAVDRESYSITAFTDYSSIVSGEVLVTTNLTNSFITGNDVEIDSTTSYDGDHDDLTIVSASTFTITATYVADDATGTAYWISDNYRYRYRTPSESKRIVSVKVGGVEVPDWIEEDGYVLTNNEDETIYVDYVKLVKDTRLYPPGFVNVLYLALAEELAFVITQSASHEERIQSKLMNTTDRAVGLDEQKKYVEESSDAWVEAGR